MPSWSEARYAGRAARSLALAAGLGLLVVVFWCGPGAPVLSRPPGGGGCRRARRACGLAAGGSCRRRFGCLAWASRFLFMIETNQGGTK